MTLCPAPGRHWLRPPADGGLGPTAHCSDRHSSAPCQRVLGGSRSVRGRCIFMGRCALQGQGGSLHAHVGPLLGTAQGVQREALPLAGPGWCSLSRPCRIPEPRTEASLHLIFSVGWDSARSGLRLEPGVNLSLTRALDVASMVWGRRGPHPVRGPVYEGSLVWQRSVVMGNAIWNL